MREQQQNEGRPVRLEMTAEPLERRLLLDGNVTARVLGGNLVINGDSDANGVQITEVDRGQYLVTGIDCGNGPTEINGQPSDLLRGVTRDFRITLRGGADCLQIGTPEQPAENGVGLSVPDDLFIRVNAGSDDVRLENVTVADWTKIWLETGDDNLYVAASDFGRDHFAFGQSGDDNMQFHDVTVVGRMYVKSHRDHDVITMSEIDVSGNADINTGNGEDQVFIGVNGACDQSPTFGLQATNLIIQTGNDRDEVEVRDSGIANLFTALLGNGNDRMIAANNTGRLMWLNGNAPFQLQSGDGDAINADVQFVNAFDQIKLFDSFEIFVV